MNRFRLFYQYINSFIPLPEEIWQGIIPHLMLRKLGKDDYFSTPSNPSTQIAFVTSGLLKTFYNTPDGQERITEFCSEGTLTASYELIHSGIGRDFTMQAIEDTELICLDLVHLNAIKEQHSVLEDFRKMQIEHYYKEKLEREQILLGTSGAERLSWFYQHRGDIKDRVPQYMIASYLGLTPEALCRLKKSLNSPE